MPTYDFKCRACDHKFALFLSIKEKEHAVCPHCGSSEVTQLFTGFLFNKGSVAGASTAGAASAGSGGCGGRSCGGCSGC